MMCCVLASAQRPADWATSGSDAQRSSWVRADAKISKDSLQKPGFQLSWKVKLNNEPQLTPPVLLDRYIGYRGFRSLAFLAAGSDHIYAIDTDLGRIEWQKHLSPTCAGASAANVTRATSASFPAAVVGGRGGGTGRGGPAKSSVGQPGYGAITVPQTSAPAAPAQPAAAARRAAVRPIRAPELVYVLSSDGMLRRMYVSNGADADAPLPWLPANAAAHGLIVIDNVAYAATGPGCGGGAHGIWTLDLSSRQVSSWKSSGAIAGSNGAAIAPDGTLYVATGAGEMVALEPATLKVKDSYRAWKQDFTSSPVLFQYKRKNLIAATTRDGRMHLLDSAALGGETPLYKTPPSANAADFVPGALASWQDDGGTRWVLASTAGAIVAWKIVDQAGAPTLQPGWVSRDMVSPLPPIVMNGVVFAVSSGAQRSSPAVLYALDAATGKELWNSGKTITSSARGGGLSAGGSQLFLGTNDGTLYAFGFPIEH